MNSRASVPLTLWILVAGLWTAQADEKIAVLAAGGDVYSNITVTSVSATDVYFTYSGGMANVKLKTLSPEWQKHFNFDPAKARAAERQQADNETRYHDEIIRSPAVQPGNAAPKTVIILAPPVWRENLPAALAEAQSKHKFVLLSFTASDWSPPSVRFDRDVLSTPQFALYAQSKLVLVKVDFPRQTPQSIELKRANGALIKQFAVIGFPTYVLLGRDGKELGRQVGYLAGGPNAFIKELDGFSPH